MLNDLLMGARFLRRLPGFLRQPITRQEAEGILRHRLQHREAAFLALARRAIFDQPASIYRRLLGTVGCELGDLEALVERDGVEGALRALCRQGVYVTVDEFKGRRPIVRGTTTIEVTPAAFWNPLSTVHALFSTSGSRGAGTPVPLDLDAVRDSAVNFRLVLAARGGDAWRHAIWWVPGGMALNRLLTLGAVGIRPARWFAQVDPSAAPLHPRYRWSAHAVRWGGLVAGLRFPPCEHVPLAAPLPIARWMSETLRAGAVPNLSTFPGAALRLVEAARAGGVDLAGAKVALVGEPVTAARLAGLAAAGVEAFHGYGSAEAGGIAWGCLRPDTADDSHVSHDRLAVVQPGDTIPRRDLPPATLLLSTLSAKAAVLLLNVSLGDEACLSGRACGCPLEALGWTTHVHTIRSFEKLTAASTNLLDRDVIGVLEQVLPARFGGGPAHYQLIEDEGPRGEPRIRLLVHPAVGAVDPAVVADVFLSAIGRGSGSEYLTSRLWSDGDVLQVERQPPRATPSGKILHVLSQRRAHPVRHPVNDAR